MFEHRTVFEDANDPFHKPLFVVYVCAVAVLWVYSISKWKNMYHALVSTRFFTDKPGNKAGRIMRGDEPHVTIQICTYNEGTVVRQTIDRACSVDWPKDKLSVQVLDDSVDQTSKRVVLERIDYWCSRGLDIHHMSRPTRVGYKAGSLHYHFGSIEGDFVAQLDADHRMEPDFLRRAMPFFFDKDGKPKEEIGLIQAPWGFYNVHQNLLVEVDSLGLDIHHVFEQTGRAAAYGCFGFNGTGGIWRKQAIKAAGGWSWETVTEDLALSYQAAIAGYKFDYARDIPQLLEVPANFMAHVQQKNRWTKGYLQVFRLSYWNILLSRELSPVLKFEAFCHTTTQVQYPAALLTLFIFPYLVIHGLDGPYISFFSFIPAVLPILAAVIACFAKVSGSDGNYRSFWSRLYRLRLIVPYVALNCGMALFETKSILEGLFSSDATFLTTPKEGSSEKVEDHCANRVKMLWKDDVAAVCGVFVGIHRLIFLITAETSRFYMDTLCRVLNAFICLAFFWVNGGFLVEKYGKRLTWTSSSRRLLILFLLLLSVTYSYMLSFAFLQRERMLQDLALRQVQPPVDIASRGVYFMASDRDLDASLAFLNSFRHFNPETPLALVPTGEWTTQKIRSLAEEYDFQVYFDQDLFKQIDQVAQEIERDGKLHPQYRKLALWSGPFKDFLFIDVDTIVLDSIDFAWPLLNQVDVATATSTTDDSQVSIDVAEKLTPEKISFASQTGAILSSRSFASTEQLLDKISTKALQHKEHFAQKHSDQRLLNYLFITSGKRYNSFSKMAEAGGRLSPKLEAQAEDDSVKVTDDHRVRWKEAKKESPPIFLLHWEESQKLSLQMPNYELWRYWHDLKTSKETAVAGIGHMV